MADRSIAIVVPLSHRPVQLPGEPLGPEALKLLPVEGPQEKVFERAAVALEVAQDLDVPEGDFVVRIQLQRPLQMSLRLLEPSRGETGPAEVAAMAAVLRLQREQRLVSPDGLLRLSEDDEYASEALQ